MGLKITSKINARSVWSSKYLTIKHKSNEYNLDVLALSSMNLTIIDQVLACFGYSLFNI